MKCRRAKQLIFDFRDGMIGDQDRIALEQHLNACSPCDEYATSMAKSLDLLHRVEPVKLDDNFAWKVRLRIARERNALAEAAASHTPWYRSFNVGYAVSAASAFAVVLFAGYFAVGSLMPAPAGNGFANPTPILTNDNLNNVVLPPAERRSAVSLRPTGSINHLGNFVSGAGTSTTQPGFDNSPGSLIEDTSNIDVNALRAELENSHQALDALNDALNDCKSSCAGSSTHQE